MSDDEWFDVAYARLLRAVFTLCRLEYLKRIGECDR